ncbi:RagB/SusD family nutrient uptake outer membrane protein [Mucilaginibacter sabulilitoris]|uniref:RagB/SusD family nutrient uptake outer membrane protein n=1 Tax=Mucilaginibacter sabulilitoris TaxID=1173583 RepID=A0ABZ0TK07_9SPHI|nr:RagB/SusD family nutrient uptake outer membrane protein [Mucilaginibacter sabulilitoris]WPU92767.1 RagB/SusD family nutrient uptake outer membrane protein [Mucilaginibacter sabulilitoris]
MKSKIYIAALVCVCLLSCKKTLDTVPQGTAASSDLNTPANVDKMVIAAYSALGNDEYMTPYSSMWPYGSIRSGDAYKGGDGPGDVSEFHGYETFSLNRVDYGPTDALWFRIYVGIGRVNDALSRVNVISETDFPNKAVRQGELRFLRGHFYFLLKILFKYVPYIDENVAKTDYPTISNRALTDDALWKKIEDDFRAGVASLPKTQPEVGRANKYAAEAYLAKALLYHAYTQDDNNNVTGIDQAKLTEVNSLCDDVINSGAYALLPDFANNFLSQYENGKESVFAIQYSINDGTPQGREDFGHELNYPMNQEYGCCGFHVPSNNLINAFKTDNTGLPMFGTFNNNDIEPSGDYKTNSFDPRIDHTVATPGHPYKYRASFIFQTSWARAPQVYGPHLSMKETVLPDDAAFKKFPPFMSSGKNWAIIRYADVLLFKAEALIELGRQLEAVPLINQIRQRALNSESLLKQANGSAISNYKIDIYKPGVNCNWTQDFARQAMRFERRLEFAMEGYRFFDLVRWGIAADYMNSYFAVEKTRKSHLQDAVFKKNRDEYMPIPLNQINFSKGLYKQNQGW